MSDNETSNQGEKAEGTEPKSPITRLAAEGRFKNSEEERGDAPEVEKCGEENIGQLEDEESCEDQAVVGRSLETIDQQQQEEARLTRALGSISITLPYSGSYSNTTIRVGRDYQAVIPEVSPMKEKELEKIPEKALCLWTPELCQSVSECELEEFCEVARAQYGYTMEQSLGMLHFHKYDIQRALADLSNFFPQKDEWTLEDKVLFEQAFSFHGKNFTRIKQLMPLKTMANLVDYYYSWKKTRNYTSYMDNQAEPDEESSDSDDNEGDDSDEVNKDEKKKICENCRQQAARINETPAGNICNACHLYWKKSGGMRPCKKRLPSEHPDSADRRKGQTCPKGFDLNVDQLRQFAEKNPEYAKATEGGNDEKKGEGEEQSASSSYQKPKQIPPPTKGEVYLKDLDFRIFGLKSKAVKNSKFIERTAKEAGIYRLTGGIDKFRLPKSAKPRFTNKWTDRDSMLAVQGFRRYGKNFQAISDVVQTKSVDAVKMFLRDNRGRYQLDKLISEYEADRDRIKSEIEEEKRRVNKDCITVEEIAIDDDDTGVQTLD